MTPSPRALTAATFGAWLVKVRPDLHPGDAFADLGVASAASWCVRPTYRLDLVEPGQPVLLWLSGSSTTHPAGLHAEGRTTGVVARDAPPGSALQLPVELRPLAAPVLRAELLAHPLLAQIEVLRMPAGSNPSFLTRTELAALRSGWPQVTVAQQR